MSRIPVANSLLVRGKQKAGLDVAILPVVVFQSPAYCPREVPWRRPGKLREGVRNQWGLCLEAHFKTTFAVLLAPLLADSKDVLSLLSEATIPAGPISSMLAREAGLALPIILRGASRGKFPHRWDCRTNTKAGEEGEEENQNREAEGGERQEIKEN